MCSATRACRIFSNHTTLKNSGLRWALETALGDTTLRSDSFVRKHASFDGRVLQIRSRHVRIRAEREREQRESLGDCVGRARRRGDAGPSRLGLSFSDDGGSFFSSARARETAPCCECIFLFFLRRAPRRTGRSRRLKRASKSSTRSGTRSTRCVETVRVSRG